LQICVETLLDASISPERSDEIKLAIGQYALDSVYNYRRK